jgi:hypothetical protein
MTNFRQSILQADDLPKQSVEISAWPHLDDDGQVITGADGNPECTYFVRAMTLGERDAFDSSVTVPDGDSFRVDYSKVRGQLLVRTMCDESGNRLFTDADAAIFSGKSADACLPAFVAAQALNGLTAKNA